jgi:hypothetical protein
MDVASMQVTEIYRDTNLKRGTTAAIQLFSRWALYPFPERCGSGSTANSKNNKESVAITQSKWQIFSS